ncbi:MAG TPA: kelch repeat-containing protein [Anaeromyxobacter sp.]|nr:kelch repeat-containing protein [Anaeromyxobacter sp.]
MSIRPFAIAVVAVTLSACSGETSSQSPSIAVTISPPSAALLVGATARFTATVSGAARGDVIFTVVEGEPGGSIGADGRYVAPRTPGGFHVRATSADDPTRYVEATVTVADYQRGITQMPDGSNARDHHTATLLPDGSVLVVGGIAFEQRALAAADRFDPGARAFRDGGALVVPRMAHAAVLLGSGEVLVTGGWDPGVPGTSSGPASGATELYDAAASRFRAGPDMLVPRRGHSMTLLANGSVLVAGGVEHRGRGFPATTASELFDPPKEAFRPGQHMVQGRWQHTATLLADGRVLLVGGRADDYPSAYAAPALSSAEVYDPAAGEFTATGSLLASRYGHSATRLADGRVLVLGGETTQGFGAGPAQVPTAEIWDPATGAFTSAGSLADGRGFHAAVELNDGTFLLVGGNRNEGLPSGTTEIFDPARGAPTPGPQMSERRIRATATKLATGEVLVVGGNSSAAAVRPVDLFL